MVTIGIASIAHWKNAGLMSWEAIAAGVVPTPISCRKRKTRAIVPMMKTVRFVPLLLTTFGFAAYASAEIYYPWCANYGDGGGGTNCGFSTHYQCMGAIRGKGGFSAPNPFFTADFHKT